MAFMRKQSGFLATAAIAAVSMTVFASLPAHAAAQSNASGVNNVKNVVDHGGPVLSAADLYAIWWGPASGFPADEQAKVTTFLQGFGSSDYLQIAKQYMRGATPTATFKGTFFD